MIVTVSNEYGCGALAIAKRVAAELGYAYVDDQLPVVVAKRLSISPEEVEASEDTARTFGERWLTVLERATPELASGSTEEPFDARLLRAVQDAVREYASAGNVVLIGRGSGTILGARPDVVRLFMHAPLEWRIERVIETTHVDRKTAETEIERVDRARAAYMRAWYGVTFGDPKNYELSLDTSHFGETGSATLIVTAVRERMPS